MSLIARAIFENKQLFAFAEAEMTKEEFIISAKKQWVSGETSIESILKLIKSKNYKVDIISQQNYNFSSLSSLKSDLMMMFSHNLNMKSFIITWCNSNPDKYECYWFGEVIGDRLIVANFANIPTGNMIFNRSIYVFNYYDIQII